MPASNQELLLDVQDIYKAFGDHAVLNGADLQVPRGHVVTVLGRSGGGKSVFLKCLAGVLQPERGCICFDGQDLATADARARAEFRRRCGFLFQHNALFDSLTVLENVALPLEQTTDLGNAKIRERSLEALSLLELDKYSHLHPAQLSGGMQKRLALARAIVTQPELVLFDEPTAGLDPLRRNAVFQMIAQLQRQTGFTAVIITHDVAEALVASDRVALLEQGRMHFQGTPEAFGASQDPVITAFRDSTIALSHALNAIRHGQPSLSKDS